MLRTCYKPEARCEEDEELGHRLRRKRKRMPRDLCIGNREHNTFKTLKLQIQSIHTNLLVSCDSALCFKYLKMFTNSMSLILQRYTHCDVFSNFYRAVLFFNYFYQPWIYLSRRSFALIMVIIFCISFFFLFSNSILSLL